MKPAQYLLQQPFKALFILMLFGIMSVILNSCGRCAGCSEMGGLAFYNFSKIEMDSVIIKQYIASSNFTALKDSIVLKPGAGDSAPYLSSLPFAINGDSTDILVYLPADS